MSEHSAWGLTQRVQVWVCAAGRIPLALHAAAGADRRRQAATLSRRCVRRAGADVEHGVRRVRRDLLRTHSSEGESGCACACLNDSD